MSKSEVFLEYASDIEMLLKSEKLSRKLTCDKQSKEALVREEWFANEYAKIKEFATAQATKCVNNILTELGKDKIEINSINNN